MRVTHGDEIVFADASIKVDVAGLLSADHGFPGEAISPYGLVVVAEK